MTDGEQFENCPLEYRLNCAYYGVMCNSCSASYRGNSSLKYSPLNRVEMPYKSHPQFIKEKEKAKLNKRETTKAHRKTTAHKTAKKNSLAGRKAEKKVLAKLDGKSTAGSGAVFGDGDGTVVFNSIECGIEHKLRINNKNTLGPTAAEWEKALAQGATIFITTSSTQGSIITMRLEDFKELLKEEN